MTKTLLCWEYSLVLPGIYRTTSYVVICARVSVSYNIEQRIRISIDVVICARVSVSYNIEQRIRISIDVVICARVSVSYNRRA